MLTLWAWKVTNLGGSEHWSTFWSTVSILGLHNDFNRKHRSLVVRSRRVCRKIILFSSSFRADTWFWSIHSSHDPFEIYGWKCSGYLILLCSSSLRWQNISKVNCFRVYRKLITWSSHAKKGSPFVGRGLGTIWAISVQLHDVHCEFCAVMFSNLSRRFLLKRIRTSQVVIFARELYQ